MTETTREPAATRRTTCAKCGAVLQPGAHTGRPARYCGNGCKRAAGYEITRINRLLADLENRASRERQTANFDHLQDQHGRTKADRLAALQSEINHAEARLLELLSDDETTTR